VIIIAAHIAAKDFVSSSHHFTSAFGAQSVHDFLFQRYNKMTLRGGADIKFCRFVENVFFQQKR